MFSSMERNQGTKEPENGNKIIGRFGNRGFGSNDGSNASSHDFLGFISENTERRTKEPSPLYGVVYIRNKRTAHDTHTRYARARARIEGSVGSLVPVLVVPEGVGA